MTDSTAQQVHDLAENATAKAHDIAENATAKARDLADQARHAVDETVTDAKAVVRDLEKSAGTAVTTGREYAVGLFDKLAAAYKGNPTLVIAVGTAAVAAVALLTGRGNKRR